MVALSLVAAAYELMVAWLEGERGLTREGVENTVMLLFESVSAWPVDHTAPRWPGGHDAGAHGWGS